MAKLFINKEICAEADKEMLWWFTGAEGVSFPDIKSFIASIPEDDGKIELEFHSCGGDCAEGWAMYDELRASGKEIHATNVGTCASMATILFLAAKKGNRKAREHSQFLIHNAYIPMYQGEMTIEKSKEINKALRAEREKLLDVYEERTGTDRKELEKQMDKGDFFGAEKALELGFVDAIEEPLSALAESVKEISTSKTNENMNDNKGMMAKVIDAIKAAFGAAEEEVVAPVALTLTTTDGTELSIEREEGEPQVGDAASPDGTHTLEDGRKIVVEEGKIVEIQQPKEEPSEEDKAKAELEAALAAAKEAQAQLEAKVAELEAEKAEIAAKASDLESQAKTEADVAILDMVEKAGGKAWLDKAASSHYEAPKRNSPKTAKVEEETGEEADTMAARIARTRKIKK